jgi:hypothetical protein
MLSYQAPQEQVKGPPAAERPEELGLSEEVGYGSDYTEGRCVWHRLNST